MISPCFMYINKSLSYDKIYCTRKVTKSFDHLPLYPSYVSYIYTFRLLFEYAYRYIYTLYILYSLNLIRIHIKKNFACFSSNNKLRKPTFGLNIATSIMKILIFHLENHPKSNKQPKQSKHRNQKKNKIFRLSEHCFLLLEEKKGSCHVHFLYRTNDVWCRYDMTPILPYTHLIRYDGEKRKKVCDGERPNRPQAKTQKLKVMLCIPKSWEL